MAVLTARPQSVAADPAEPSLMVRAPKRGQGPDKGPRKGPEKGT